MIAGAGVLTLALMCWLPYLVPVTPTFSDSYLFGYNNHVALGLVGAFALGVAVLGGGSIGLEEFAGIDEPMSPRTLRRALWLTTLIAVPLHLIVRRTGGYVESPYFLDRIKLVLDGKVPYRDFEYAYGASFLYVPAWMTRGLHLQVADAYGLFWLLVNLAGIWMLYFTVQWTPARSSAKRGIFYFLFAMSILGVLCNGVNYSILRFVLSPFLALLLYRRLEGARSAPEQMSCIALAAPCFLALLLVSPEMALSFAVGMACYVAIFVDLRRPLNLINFVGLLLLLGVMVRAASGYGLFLTLNAFRSGGFNFPVMPAAPILLLLAAVALTSAYAGRCVGARQGSRLMALISVSALTLASALGRCDGAHVLLSPLGLWIAGLALAATWPTVGRLALWGCACVFFLVPLAVSLRGVIATPARAALLTVFAAEEAHPNPKLDQILTSVATRLYGREKASLKMDEARRFVSLHDEMDLAPIYGYPSGTIFEAPLQFSPEQFGPIHTPQVDTGYFYGWVNLVTPEEVQRKIAELAANPGRPLLLPAGAENLCGISAEGERAAIRKIFLYPYSAPARNLHSIFEPVCVYLRDHYVLRETATPERLGYAVWERR